MISTTVLCEGAFMIVDGIRVSTLDFGRRVFSGWEFPFHQAGQFEVSEMAADQILFRRTVLGTDLIEGCGETFSRSGVYPEDGSMPCFFSRQDQPSGIVIPQDEIVPATFAKRIRASVVTGGTSR